MSKVALVTLHTVSNYGSCLQTYATQRLLEDLGFDVEVIDYYRADNLPERAIDKAFNGRRLQKYRRLWEVAPWLKALLSIPMGWIVKKQRAPFDNFRTKYLNLSDRMYRSADELKIDPPQADIYCTGSDQVWNSIWNGGFEEPYYLTFAPEGKRRISFAASIGRESIDEWEKPLMKAALSGYHAIAMREISGVEIVRSLGIDNAELVLDPTLMLTKEQWADIATMPSGVDKPYILVYQLNKNQEFISYVEGVAEKYGLEVVKISYGIYDVMKSAKTLIAPSVNDFVGLFLNASYVITDSFHATAYSLNFGIPFTAIAPERFSTRIASILELTHTEDRLLADVEDLEMFERPIDFENASRCLKEMRMKSLAYLKNAVA